ncbi:hypothetical protein LCGC14_0558050 [marine sediment metagenome]|uniref:Uncharacterized protein n=1 Tax=marine sediment metagenome TaxID=412755 RepID=A0A0F9S6N0_9ZZZZ
MTQAAGTTDVDAQTLVKAAQRVLFHVDADRIFDAIDQGTKAAECAKPHGGGNPPPPGQAADPDIETLPEALQGKAYKGKKKAPKPDFPKATALLAAANALLKKSARKGKKFTPGSLKAAIVREQLIKEAGRSLVILKHGNATEKRAGLSILKAIIPLLGKLGGGAGKLLGRGLGAAGAAAGKVGLGGVSKGLGAAAKAIPTSTGVGSRGAGLGALLAGGAGLGGSIALGRSRPAQLAALRAATGGLLGGGAVAGRASKSAPKKDSKKEPKEQEAAA